MKGSRKRCTKCRALRPTRQFTKRGDSRRAECRRCERGQKLFRRYGITLVQYERLYRKQNGRCGICQKRHPNLAVDHCHTTKRVRGLLCKRCNTALGDLHEDPKLLVRAASYALEHMEIRTNANPVD